MSTFTLPARWNRSQWHTPGRVAIAARGAGGVNRDDVVQAIVQMVKGQNATKVIAALKDEIAKLEPRLPPGVRIVPHYDRTELVEHTVHTVTHNLAQARRIADYAAFLLNGDVIEEGFAEQVFESPTQQQTADFVAGIFG